MIWAEGWLGINGAVEDNSLKWSSKNFYLPPRCSPHPPQLKWPKQAVHRRRSPKGVLNWRVSISFPQCPLLSQSQLPHTKCTVKWERYSVTMQCDHARCYQPSIHNKTKVPFLYESHVLKSNLCFGVNGRLGTPWMVTLYSYRSDERARLQGLCLRHLGYSITQPRLRFYDTTLGLTPRW